jgi:hypothetical protein
LGFASDAPVDFDSEFDEDEDDDEEDVPLERVRL